MIWQTLETRRYSLPDFWSGEFKGRGKREEELHNAHDDWVPTRYFPSLIALGNVHWSTNLLNPAHAQIKHTMNCILSNNVIGQTPCKFVDAAVFVSIFTQREDKKKVLCRTHYSLPTTPPAPFKYGWLLLHQTKGRIGNEKNLNKCKIRGAHNPDHIPFKVPKICLEPLVKFIFKN